MSWARRLLNTFRAGRTDRDIARELSFHVSERIDQLRAEGVPLDEARLAAQRQLGNSLRLRKEAYQMNRIGWMDRLMQDVRLTSRMLRGAAFAGAAISTLAIGIGATTAVFSLVYARVLIRAAPTPSPIDCRRVPSAQFQETTSNNVRLTSTSI